MVEIAQLEPVRTDQALYAENDFTVPQLYGSRYFKIREDVDGRVTAGYVEQMFGGLSTEVLWKPSNQFWGLGIEANYVRKRDYGVDFQFLDYTVFTGHASLYADLPLDYKLQIDAGRYLAGDVGATFSLDREFDNGWLVGGFFTLTNVSAEEFGEGSFDKGMRISIPISWFTGLPSRSAAGTTLRVIQRDGGQRLQVPGRLYSTVRASHTDALESQWSRVWQ